MPECKNDDSDKIKQRVVARMLEAMAYDRQTFKDRIEEHIGGAILEFYKATLAKKNGETRWVQHWMTEVHTLLDHNLVLVITHEIRGFKDVRKAYNEVIAAIAAKDGSYRGIAARQIKRDFKSSELKVLLDDTDTAAFWERVNTAAEDAFAERK